MVTCHIYFFTNPYVKMAESDADLCRENIEYTFKQKDNLNDYYCDCCSPSYDAVYNITDMVDLIYIFNGIEWYLLIFWTIFS